jgi:hypothetical protein
LVGLVIAAVIVLRLLVLAEHATQKLRAVLARRGREFYLLETYILLFDGDGQSCSRYP